MNSPPSRAVPRQLRVAVPRPLLQAFDYLLPPGVEGPWTGCRVRVPFGRGSLVGIAVEEPRTLAQAGAEGLRDIEARLDPAPLLADELGDSLGWLARYLHAPLGEVLATALPAALRRGEPLPETHREGWRLTEAGQTALPAMRTGRPKALAGLLAHGPLDTDGLDTGMPGWRAALRALQARGLVEAVVLPRAQGHDGQPGPALNGDQQVAADSIRAARGFAPILLDGVTGSGKTEVYLDAIKDCLARGKQALVLVPEIGLTPQALARFRERLGVPVHASHSGLTDNERAATWTAALRGDARVIVGTRSAVFTPLPDAGIVIVDEEHDGSYKQFDGIRYHARDFAVMRARALGIPVVLGSATPSLETLHNARSGRYAHLRLSARAGNAQPPRVRVVDVRKRPLDAGMAPELFTAIRAALDAGGQVLVFRNRRGYAPVLLCHDCGWSAQCPRCSTPERGMPMTVHAGGHRLQCHHCGTRRPAPRACPDCGGLALQPQGNGTERIEDALAQRFGDVPVIRIDRGSTQGRDALQAHFDTLGSAPGILVGTQMLAKGHDLANLTLVAVVGVDEGLFSADFRASEKLAQLLVQVAGRAGRADKPGEVLLQTHHPEHPLLQVLVNGGYHAFAETELLEREAAAFPPFAHLALLRAEAKDAEAPLAFLQAARPAFAGQAIEINGPMPAPMPRRGGMQRAQLLLSSPSRSALQQALDAGVPALYDLPEARKVRWSLDVDPVDLY